jgi:hypothetical protein
MNNISQSDIQKIYKSFGDNINDYRYITDDKIRTGINIKYYDPETQKLSPRATIMDIYYFSQIKKNKPLSLVLYNAEHHSSWKITYKKYIIFRQYTQKSHESRMARQCLGISSDENIEND